MQLTAVRPFPTYRLPRLDQSLAVSILLVVAFTLVYFGGDLRPVVALLPLPAAIGVAAIRKAPPVAAAALPLISIGADGLLVHLNHQTPIRLSTVVLAVLLWTHLSSRSRFHLPALPLAAWLGLLLLTNYWLVALPTGSAINTRLLALLLEGLVVSMTVASIRPNPHLVLAAVALSGLFVAYFAYFPDYEVGGRPFALGLDPNYIGTILAVGITATATLARARSSLLLLVLAVPMVGGLLQVQGRSSVLAASVGLLGALSLSTDRLRGLLILLTVACFVAAGYLFGVRPGFGAFTNRRIDTVESTRIREEITLVNVNAVKSAPATGVGLGVVEELTREDPIIGATVSHNEYLRIAAETGIPSLAGLLMILGVPVLVGLTSTRRRSSAALLWPPLAACLVAMGFLNVLDNAQLATLIMTLAGAAWASVDLRHRGKATEQPA